MDPVTDTDDVHRRIQEVLHRYDQFDTPDLIYNAGVFASPRFPETPTEKDQLRFAGASIAFQRALVYLAEFHMAFHTSNNYEERIRKLLDQQGLLTGPGVRKSEDLGEIAEEIGELHHFNDFQLHLIGLCASMIEKLLRTAARRTGSKIDRHNELGLGHFSDLRNLFEHVDGHLPGTNRQAWLVQKRKDGIWVGVERDELNRVIVNGKPVEVNRQGYLLITSAFESIEAAIRQRSLKHIRTALERRPDYIDAAMELRSLSATELRRLK